MAIQIREAKREQRALKLLEIAVSGAGKTYTALELATGLGGKILVGDTENNSSCMYADRFRFDVANMVNTEADSYIELIREASKQGYNVLIIDSLSHAWESLLEKADEATLKNKGGNSYTAWKNVTPIYTKLIRAIVAAPIHIIATVRAKSEYVMEEYSGTDGKTRTKPVKVGLAPIFRQGGEYEFDVVATLDLEHNLLIEKTRIDWLADKVYRKPTRELGEQIAKWLSEGVAAQPAKPPVVAKPFDGDPSQLGDYVVTTECSMKGKTLIQTLAENPDWLAKSVQNETIRAKLTPADLSAMEAYLLCLHTQEPKNENIQAA